MSGTSAEAYIAALISILKEKGCLQAEWITSAIRRVPRHLFIHQYYGSLDENAPPIDVSPDEPSEESLKDIYQDKPLLIRKAPIFSSSSQPSLVTKMLEHLNVVPGNKVLEIGTGTGWNAGLLACGVQDEGLVYSIDIQPDLIDAALVSLRAVGLHHVNLRAADGGYGWPEAAPFDRIMATVGCPDIPAAWHEQLAQGGSLLLPFKMAAVGDPLLQLWKAGNAITGHIVGWSGFQTLQGKYGTTSEDILQPPWDPIAENLLHKPPIKVSVPEPIDLNFLFYAYLEGMALRAMVDSQGRLGWNPTLFHPETDAIYVLDPKDPVIKVHGDPASTEELSALFHKWIILGRPKMTDYNVLLSPPGQETSGAYRWMIQRPNGNLQFTAN